LPAKALAAARRPSSQKPRTRKGNADAQGALSWELRAATSLARLFRDQGRSGDAIACLQPVYDRFTEGFGTADLIAANQLLDEPDDASRR
jgi:predicted ATPase